MRFYIPSTLRPSLPLCSRRAPRRFGTCRLILVASWRLPRLSWPCVFDGTALPFRAVSTTSATVPMDLLLYAKPLLSETGPIQPAET